MLHYSHTLKWFKLHFSPQSTLIMTKRKQIFWNFWQFIKKEKLKYHIDISIQTLCHNTWNLAQVPPISLDHLWDVATPWLESTCGTFNWLDIIWKGTHLPISVCLCIWQKPRQKPSHIEHFHPRKCGHTLGFCKWLWDCNCICSTSLPYVLASIYIQWLPL